MDYEREFKRLRRLVLRCFLFALALIVVAAFIGSYQLKYLKKQIAIKDAALSKETVIVKEKPIPGENGINGTNGTSIKGDKGDSVKGNDGRDGNDAPAPTADQIAAAVSAYLQANPPAVGPQGPAGRTMIVNVLTGQCKWLGDETWQPISECGQ